MKEETQMDEVFLGTKQWGPGNIQTSALRSVWGSSSGFLDQLNMLPPRPHQKAQ
jgi:hypothetical protein